MRDTRRGGVLGAVLIGLASLFVFMLLVAALTGMYVARHVRVEEARGVTSVETPFGSVKVRRDARLNPGRFGVPVYPGASRDEDGRELESVELELGNDRSEFSVLAAQYVTRDPTAKVAAFYREKLPQWSLMERSSGHDGKGGCRFELSGHGFRRVVAIHEEGGLTRIALASVGEPAAN